MYTEPYIYPKVMHITPHPSVSVEIMPHHCTTTTTTTHKSPADQPTPLNALNRAVSSPAGSSAAANFTHCSSAVSLSTAYRSSSSDVARSLARTRTSPTHQHHTKYIYFRGRSRASKFSRNCPFASAQACAQPLQSRLASLPSPALSLTSCQLHSTATASRISDTPPPPVCPRNPEMQAQRLFAKGNQNYVMCVQALASCSF